MLNFVQELHTPSNGAAVINDNSDINDGSIREHSQADSVIAEDSFFTLGMDGEQQN